ncbi:ATPase, T2SS/T4P/T4SS family [Methylotuvimicrobium sp. KM1]|uniref:ATPase, T2SS/T4P/T4SS family n=1 Tax=Methylotuvimicrobium sp. KM1 TaxID=3377707 RepID=UPI0038510E83
MSFYASLFTGGQNTDATDEQNDTQQASKSYGILLVDDEPNVLSALRRVFRQENYRVEVAMSGDEALHTLANGQFQLVISDYKMPGMNGAELLRRVKMLHPDIIRIMLTGEADTGAVLGAINEGAVYKFILKPWNNDDLRITVGLALEQYDLIEKNKKLQHDNVNQTKEIKRLSKLAVSDSAQIAIMLHKKQLLSDRQLQELYKIKQTRKDPMLKLILERDWVAEKTIRSILRKELLIEEVSLPEFQVNPSAVELLPRSVCEQHCVLPLKVDQRQLLLVMADPLDMGLQAELRFMTGLTIETVMADIAAIKKKINAVYGDEPSFGDIETIVSALDPFETIEVVIDHEDDISLEQLLQETAEPPAIRLVNSIIIEAIRLKASDIHIQPRTKSIVVRYRIDGILFDKIYIPNQLHNQLVSRIKVMAEMDITERRRPQDGRITVKTPMRIVDLRISTLPVINGEKVVMRILDRNAQIQSIDNLDVEESEREKLLHLINKPQGIVLATGPTGSGKTTTLYALLQHGVTPTKNYITIEEPVEYFLDSAGQVNVREKIGLTFPMILRAILRQDPDVILLGEIRDLETAEVAFQAALTGHLVFSTLHTNSALATVARLIDIGLKPFIVASGLEGVISQRLVRKLCTQCREACSPDPEAMRMLGPLFNTNAIDVYRGKGCEHCSNTGYKGRVCLMEILALNEAMRDLITAQASFSDLRTLAVENGYRTLIEDAFDKVVAGTTTCEEILRVLGPQSLS